MLLLCVAGNTNISTYIFTVSLKIPTLKADTLKQNFSNIGRKDEKKVCNQKLSRTPLALGVLSKAKSNYFVGVPDFRPLGGPFESQHSL